MFILLKKKKDLGVSLNLDFSGYKINIVMIDRIPRQVAEKRFLLYFL